jgi:hypothetical protein
MAPSPLATALALLLACGAPDGSGAKVVAVWIDVEDHEAIVDGSNSHGR